MPSGGDQCSRMSGGGGGDGKADLKLKNEGTLEFKDDSTAPNLG